MPSPMGARALAHAVSESFAELEGDVQPGDPLGWPGYGDAVARAQERTGELEAVVCGFATIGGRKVVLVAFEAGFFAGSVGAASAQKLVDAFDRARWSGCPVVSLVASGGCRMQEGVAALATMPRIAAAAEQLRRSGHPHVCVVTGSAHGGIWAAMVAGADVLVGVRGAAASFAGHRVPHGVEEGFDVDAQLAAGQLDLVVDDVALADLLRRLVPLLGDEHPAEGPPDVPAALGATDLPATGWEAVQRARDPQRPRAQAYLADYFDHIVELSGDRAGGVDPGMRCGIGQRGGRSIAFVAQTGVANTAAGFRTATRIIELAEALHLPVLLLVDTPGAALDADAERSGIGAALARLLAAVARAAVPMTSLVIGEGGSGGAIALAAPGGLWMTPDSYLAIIAPESATAILKRPAGEVARTAEEMRLRPQDVIDLGIAVGIAGGSAINR